MSDAMRPGSANIPDLEERGLYYVVRMGAPLLPLRGIRKIAWDISNEFDLTLAELRGRARSTYICNARFEAFARARALGYSTTAIGTFFHRDHTTVMHGLRKKGCR